MEGRSIQASGNQERQSLTMNLNLSLAPPPPLQSPLPLPPQPFPPTLQSQEFQWSLEGPSSSYSSPMIPICFRPTQLSQPPALQAIPPLRERLIFPSSYPSLPEQDVVERRQQQSSATPPLLSLPAPPQQLLSIRFHPSPDATPSMVRHRNVHGSSAGGGGAGGRGGIRPRRSSSRQPLKEDRIRPPYPWATDKRATVHPYEYLKANDIDKISGQVYCKRCEQVYTMEVELKKVLEVCFIVVRNFHDSNNRATTEWLTPKMLDCEKCNQVACVKPVTNEKKKNMNWLFLFVTQSLGYCTLEQLKYFCKHAKCHRTGAKDRVLHNTYVLLHNQLVEPECKLMIVKG
ncbi:uncharacterized protein LOC116260612 [Nymphaea colorata]|uniref:DUF7086 domain-containing protein n=1 Tax=Nymphaea colorata TaxID=210225 RepID=A0A5K1GUM1_9MAGN|nr:uncharacterized protein LOC116260612 [Nymphaea colorata]